MEELQVGQEPIKIIKPNFTNTKYNKLGITERKERAKTELRHTIIDATLKVFVEEGYEKTSLRNIAEQIEYSPGTIYLYFKDKDELLFAVHEVAFGRFFEAMAPLMKIEKPRERLLKMGEIYLKFAYDNPELYGLMFMDKAPMNSLQLTDSSCDCGLNTLDLLRKTVQQCLNSKEVTQEDIELNTISIWSYVHGLTSLGIRNRFCILDERGYQIDDLTSKSLKLMLDKLIPVLE